MARVKRLGEVNPAAIDFSDKQKFEEDREFSAFLFKETGYKHLGDYFDTLRQEEDLIEHPGLEQDVDGRVY